MRPEPQVLLLSVVPVPVRLPGRQRTSLYGCGHAMLWLPELPRRRLSVWCNWTRYTWPQLNKSSAQHTANKLAASSATPEPTPIPSQIPLPGSERTPFILALSGFLNGETIE